MVKSNPDVPQASFVSKYTPLAWIVTVHDQELFQNEAGCLPVDFCELVYNLDSLFIPALSHEVPRALIINVRSALADNRAISIRRTMINEGLKHRWISKGRT
jgi:hypothetical protein